MCCYCCVSTVQCSSEFEVVDREGWLRQREYFCWHNLNLEAFITIQQPLRAVCIQVFLRWFYMVKRLAQCSLYIDYCLCILHSVTSQFVIALLFYLVCLWLFCSLLRLFRCMSVYTSVCSFFLKIANVSR